MVVGTTTTHSVCGETVHRFADGCGRTRIWLGDTRIYLGSISRDPHTGRWSYSPRLRFNLDIRDDSAFGTESEALALLEVKLRLCMMRDRLRYGR